MPYGTVKIDSITTSTQTVSVDDLAKKTGQAFTGDITLNAQADLRFADSDSSNWVAFQAPATITSNVTWTLPSADGAASTALTTNGTGTLSWVAYLPSAGGTLTGNVTFASGQVYPQIPANSKSAQYTLLVSDAGKHISTNAEVIVPSGVFAIGDAVSIYNNSTSNITITQGASVTLRNVGTATTGNRTLAQRGLATILCVASNEFVIAGGGLT